MIGPFLPLEKLFAGVDDAKTKLAEDGWEAASRAIMTTDTVNKLAITSHRLPSSGTAYEWPTCAHQPRPFAGTVLNGKNGWPRTGFR